MKDSIAVLGGDLRQVYLARLLHADRWNVMTWGLEKANAPFGVSFDHALRAGIIVLPLPVCRGDQLNLPLTDTQISCETLWRGLHPDQIILGGSAGSISRHLKHQYDLEIWDYYDREEVQVANAVPTAEGAIMRAMELSSSTLHGSHCLVVGYGRIGKILAHRLRALGVNVTVSARRQSDIAWIEAYGYQAIHTESISEEMGSYDLIFNTVPALVLTRSCLERAKSSCILLELASMPGGIDTVAVKEYGLQFAVERGLPGIVAPESAAKYIRDAIYHILNEQGEIV